MNGVTAVAERLGAALTSAGLRLVTAESCTGGALAEAVTSIPGSSGWFDRGVVAYSNEAKQEMLGVAPRLIEAHGAVSEPVASAMALGAIGARTDCVAIAVSGIAGPGGGTVAKPVGTVCLSVAVAGRASSARTVVLEGDREEIRRQAVHAAMSDLLSVVE